MAVLSEAAPSSATQVESQRVAQYKPFSESGPPSRVAAVFLCGAFAFLELYCTQPLLPLLSRVFHASEVSAGLTVSASTLGVAISAALLALFGEHIDRKKLIVSAMAGLGIVVALTATASNLYVLALWRFAQGLLTPAIFITTIAYVTEEWPALDVPRVMSFYVAGTVFGGFVGRVCGGILAETIGWRLMFVVLAIAGLAGAVATQSLLKPPTSKVPEGEREPAWRPLVRNIRNGRLRATFAIGFCMLFALVGVFSYITFYLAQAPFHLSTTELSWLFSVYVFGLVATLAAGTVLTRFGLRTGMVTAVAISIGGVLLTLIPSLVAVAVGLSLASSGVFIAQTCANSFLRDAAPAGSRVSAAGMYVCFYYVGGTVGGVVPGLLWSAGGWSGCVTLICVLLAIAALLAFFGWRRAAGVDPIPV